MFLRNHDELTLEMVTDEERDYMYRAYAADPAMRINLGIRRRLAPLVGNDRRKMELLNGLLFSLPGTPVLYYGDEIGMGDNVYLGDRNGVRTPMQWNSDRNAGFSRSNPQRLILPVVIDPEYHFEAINVEAQQNNAHSLLWWTKRLIALRKQYQAFGRGTIDFLSPDNSHVLAFVRQHEGETILVVANLSRFVQYVELDLTKYQGMAPMELFGRARLPAATDKPYSLTLGSYAFYWMALERPPENEAQSRLESYMPPLARGLVAPVADRRRRAADARGDLAGLSRVALVVSRGPAHRDRARERRRDHRKGRRRARRDARHRRVHHRGAGDLRAPAGLRAQERRAHPRARGRVRVRPAGRGRGDARRRPRRRGLGAAPPRPAPPRGARARGTPATWSAWPSRPASRKTAAARGPSA